jgi:urease accessory protein
MGGFPGHLRLRAALDSTGRTALAEQSFRAPFHVSKPYWDADYDLLTVQVVNPTAGILAGDSLEADVAVAPGAALLLTTPGASRVFRMRSGAAESIQRFAVDRGGWLEVLPEPLVPHRGCRFRQRTRIDATTGGEVFFADLLMPGRVAHGETWGWERLCLETEVWLDGELVVRERLDQSGRELKELAVLAGSGEEACFGNALLIGGPAGPAPWRREVDKLHGDGVWLGTSPIRRGGWSIKFVARDSLRLRAALRGIRHALAPFFPRMRSDARKL